MYENYRMYRDFKNLTDYKVAKATGIHRSTFTDWKTGRSAPKLDKLKKIADFLDVPIEYITGEEKTAAPLDVLTPYEKELLHIFRTLSAEGQTDVLDYTRFKRDKEKADASKVG